MRSFSPDGTRIVTGGADRTVRVWDGETFEQQGAVGGFRDSINRVELDPNARLIVALAADGALHVSPCTPCLSRKALVERANELLTRPLTARERSDSGLP